MFDPSVAERHPAWQRARNIDQVSVSPVADLNVLSLLSARTLLVTKGALDALKESASQANSSKAS